jgi:cobalamin biosynthesis Mg chelatase CobN
MAKKLEESAMSTIDGVGAAKPGAALETLENSPTEDAPSSPAHGTLVATLQSRIETMSAEFCNIKAEMEAWRKRSERAEAEKDATAQTLAQMVLQAKKVEDAHRAAEERKSRSRSRRRNRSGEDKDLSEDQTSSSAANDHSEKSDGSSKSKEEEATAQTSLSRSSTITPGSTQLDRRMAPQSHVLIASLPYITMVGVVAVGVSLMAYFNQGWQPPSKPIR